MPQAAPRVQGCPVHHRSAGLSVLLVAAFVAGLARAADSRALFDGASLAGWSVLAGEEKWWSVADGTIVGGSLTETVPRNTFLATKEAFGDFELRFAIRIRGAGGFVNSGIQIRSVRVPRSHEMRGYQVDAGPGWWGKLYDESRRSEVIGEPQDAKALAAVIKEGDWNEYRIRAEGPAIRSWINGIAALDFVESDAAIPLTGLIGIQVHGGGKALVELRDIRIETLAPAVSESGPGRAVSRAASVPPGGAAGDAPLSAAEEAARFTLAAGFGVELVLEEGVDPDDTYGKFVALAFDGRGRLWTTTALEYPIDANESPEASRRLFEAGGRDKVLVVPDPWAAKPSPPHVFAAGLAMPLGVLPYRDGAFVQYGPEIRFYRDANGDGRSDGHETVLAGFGVQDSHLFPHQFTRVPGNWILLAQGLFNTSLVVRPGGRPFADGTTEVPFTECKLARMRPDGSAFEALTGGPNNIWGLTISREGEMWIQEANDIGFPIAPYEPGALYPTRQSNRLKPYQPMMPAPLGPAQMGGTGLSGLALADDLDGWPGPWGAGAGASPDERVFYVANPLTNRIQSIIATRDGPRFSYRKGPDLLASSDTSFRPVAVQFGPDGCLYVVDWYNKIISHNEVPRNHPDRDRVRGRIWRIRHASQPVRRPVVVANLPTEDLLGHLGDPNARIADLAWQEIVDREALTLVPTLRQRAAAQEGSVASRAGCLWALEGLGATTVPLLETLVADPSARLRHEAIRIAASVCNEAEFRRLAEPLLDDPDPSVRASLGDALRRISVTEPETVALIMRLGQARATGDRWAVYDRDFERYLARWALERHGDRVAAFLDSPAGRTLPLENRLLATLALEPQAAAVGLVRLLPEISRPLDGEELRVLASRADVPAVGAAIRRMALAPASRASTLRGLLALRTSLSSPGIGPIVAEAAPTLLAAGAAADDVRLGLELAGSFKLRSIEPRVAGLIANPETAGELRRAAIRCLRELGGMTIETMRTLLAATAADAELRAAAITACAESRDPETCAAVVETWGDLTFHERQAVATLLARHREGARAILAAIRDDDVDPVMLPPSCLADMRTVIGNDATLEKIWLELTADATGVLRLPGSDPATGATVSLSGPFTVEAWVSLEAPIGNEDSLAGADGLLDMNFHDGRLRVWTKQHGDLVVARSAITPGAWMHCAVTRDAEGMFRIYIDGELDAQSTARESVPYPGVRIGYSTVRGKNKGTLGRLAEFRVWNHSRTADEIRADFDRSFSGDQDRPAGLVSFHGGTTWGVVEGDARVEPAIDAPRLVTAAALAVRTQTFNHFRGLAERGGDAARGRELFASKCLVCHQQAGQGGRVGPALDGVGVTGIEAMLRNVLTPNAAMEGGYRTFRVVTRDGRIVQGLFVMQDAGGIVIRQPNLADLRVPSRDVSQAGYTNVSIMPEGLLESMPPADVSDLFAYLKTLGAAAVP